MPYIEINGAQIFYELFGQDQPGRSPILLIHGSTITGQADWSLVAPLLARHWRVIVPDCRGHGRSSNPNLSYSFREMADDVAALIGALGYERAHVIGHSNGGNVALVTLLEHPEVVQTAIPQAANAYVSPDLLEREPPLFDPERVKRISPAWMEEMIALHGPTHGAEYWRDLLRLTLQETISQPKYSPADLGAVQRPTLVIQGEHDPVNAPAGHAQFIAQHIPYAELWLPPDTRHNVHHERLFEWIQRVEDFLERRGDPANEALYRLKCERFPDERETVFQVHVRLPQGGEDQRILTGRVLTSNQRPAALDALSVIEFPGAQQPLVEQIQVLLDESTPWALVNRNVSDLRREPRNLSERVSQALIGQAVRILEDGGEWVWVRMELDGYMGWMHASALQRCSQADVVAYQSSCQALVQAVLLEASLLPELAEKLLAGKLPFGARLPVETLEGSLAQVRLPDGRLWWVERRGLLSLDQAPSLDVAGIAQMLGMVHRFIGVPYLWGGSSPFGYDCSGLSQAFYGFMGLNLPRDADQQFRLGKPVESTPQPGDLLFFGNPADARYKTRQASITHVAISLGEHELIHATGSVWSTTCNSLNPQSPIYREQLRENLIGVRRFV